MFMRSLFLIAVVMCSFSLYGCSRRCCKCCYDTSDKIKFESNRLYRISFNDDCGEWEKTELKSFQDYIDNIVLIITTFNKCEQNTLLVDYSVLDSYNNVKDQYTGIDLGSFCETYDGYIAAIKGIVDPQYQSVIGCMLGMAIGDSVGAPYEFSTVDSRFYDARNYSKTDSIPMLEGYKPFIYDMAISPGQWTDDTSMGLCLADSLIVNKGELINLDVMRRFLAWWYCGYNNASRFSDGGFVSSWGVGGNIRGSFHSFLRYPTSARTTYGNETTSGNGSVMRNAAIPITFKDIDKALQAAAEQSYITHKGLEAAECCKLLTFICSNFISGEKKSTMSDSLDELLQEGSDVYKHLALPSVIGLAKSKKGVPSARGCCKKENWDWKNNVFEYNRSRVMSDPSYIGSYVMDAMAMSLHILYHTNTFEQAIRVASRLCGDADTVAAVVGQIAGAFYGVSSFPEQWLEDLYYYDHGELTKKALILNGLNKAS
ncbi:MAG: ADP-ribosylglycohydrolase family protein [Cytophagales bacterium]|nr:ADP-ribosylglycohydrolase family protein [Cytophagales bacterium]